MGIAGQSLLTSVNAPNLGSMYVMLKEFHHRPGLSADDISASLLAKIRHDQHDALVTIFGASADRRARHNRWFQTDRRGSRQPGFEFPATRERRDCHDWQRNARPVGVVQ